MSKERHSTHIPKLLANIVKSLATEENRSFAGQLQTLIEEALATRSSEEKSIVASIKQKLPRLSAEELSDLSSEASAWCARKLKSKISKPGNEIAKLVINSKEVCCEYFADLPGILEDIMAGIKPEEEHLPLLAACLSMDLEDLLKIYRREFENGNETSTYYSGCNGGCSA